MFKVLKTRLYSDNYVEPPRHGEVRTKTRFAWFPRLVNLKIYDKWSNKSGTGYSVVGEEEILLWFEHYTVQSTFKIPTYTKRHSSTQWKDGSWSKFALIPFKGEDGRWRTDGYLSDFKEFDNE
jgi:hypothetical protein